MAIETHPVSMICSVAPINGAKMEQKNFQASDTSQALKTARPAKLKAPGHARSEGSKFHCEPLPFVYLSCPRLGRFQNGLLNVGKVGISHGKNGKAGRHSVVRNVGLRHFWKSTPFVDWLRLQAEYYFSQNIILNFQAHPGFFDSSCVPVRRAAAIRACSIPSHRA